MAASAVVPDRLPVRSISMPSRAHPIAQKAEEELHRLRTCVAPPSSQPTFSMSIKTMCNGLRGLGDVYSYVQDLLRLPSNQQGLFSSNQKKLLEEEVEASMRLLDLCSATKDALTTLKEQVQGLQSALRRRVHSDTEDKVHAYIRATKEARKVIQRCYKELKHLDKSVPPIHKDTDLSGAAKILNEAREVTVSLLCLVLSFISMPKPRPTASIWSLVSKAMRKRKVACVEDSGKMGSIHFLLFSCRKDVGSERLLMVQNQMEAFEVSLSNLENGLEFLFRGLLQNRVSLLNILSL